MMGGPSKKRSRRDAARTSSGKLSRSAIAPGSRASLDHWLLPAAKRTPSATRKIGTPPAEIATCIRDRLFANLRCGAGLQSLHGGEMDLCKCDGRVVSLAGNRLFCSPQFWSCRQVSRLPWAQVPVVNCFEGFDLVWARINHH